MTKQTDDVPAEDWQTFFAERAHAAEFVAGQSLEQSRATAFECCIVKWLEQHFTPSAPDFCAECGEPDPESIVPYGSEVVGHVWLHPECWDGWHKSRRAMAMAELEAAGLENDPPECRT